MADPIKTKSELIASEKSLKERLKFVLLLAELSAHFVYLPGDRIDSNIEDAQRRIREHLDLDRFTLWQVLENESCEFKADICNLALETSTFFGLQVVENRYKLNQVTCKTYARMLKSISFDQSPIFERKSTTLK